MVYTILLQHDVYISYLLTLFDICLAEDRGA